MGFFSDILNSLKEKKDNLSENKFENLTDDERKTAIKKLLSLSEKQLQNEVRKKPYVLSYIIDNVTNVNLEKLVDIATANGASLYSLIDKSSNISNEKIVNIAVRNQPELVVELEDMPNLQDMITVESLIEAFKKNPEVLFSNCKALNEKIEQKGVYKNGKQFTRKSTIKTQLQRALNLYFRPDAYKGNVLDAFAIKIAESIDNKKFKEIVAGNKMIMRSTTAANETLKRNPEKGRVFPAKALKHWNNRTLYVIPNEVRKHVKNTKVEYQKYYDYMLGLLHNSALNSFSEKQRINFVKKCVKICPELYFTLDKINCFEGFSRILTIQLSAYETFKSRNELEMQNLVLGFAGEEQKKVLLAKAKANKTRQENKKHKKEEKAVEAEKTL